MKNKLQNKWQAGMDEQQEDALIERALRQKFDADLRKKWQQQLSAEQGIERNETAKIVAMPARRRWLAVAAAAVVLMGAGWFLFLQNEPVNATQLADQFIDEVAGQAAQITMGADTSGEKLWLEAKEFFAKGQYPQAISNIEKLSAGKMLTVEQSYLLAMAFTKLSPAQFNMAELHFLSAQNKNLAAKTDAYQAEIEWMLALVYFQTGDSEKAQARLNAIVEAEGWYAKKAQQLLLAK